MDPSDSFDLPSSFTNAEIEDLLREVLRDFARQDQGLPPNPNALAVRERSYPSAVRLIRHFARARGVAADLEDFVQEVWVEILKALQQPASAPRPGHCVGWLSRLVRNRAADWVRSRSRHPSVAFSAEQEAELLSHEPGPEWTAELRETRTFVYSMLDLLVEQTSELNVRIFRQHRFDGRSIEEIAAALELTCEQVRLLSHRTMKRFTKLVRRHRELMDRE